MAMAAAVSQLTYLNCKTAAAIAIKSMESGPYEDNDELRKQGYLQYKHTLKKATEESSLQKGAAVEFVSDMTADQYLQVAAHMGDPRNPVHVLPNQTNPQSVASTPAGRRRRKPTANNDGGSGAAAPSPEENAKLDAVRNSRSTSRPPEASTKKCREMWAMPR